MIKTYKKKIFAITFAGVIITGAFTSCTKIQDGFLSPYVQYAVNEFTIVRGRVSTSYALITDGSNIPLHAKWIHIYDSTGKIVDDIFRKKYVVGIWTAGYDPLIDTNYASIVAKRALDSLPPILVNESNGTISTNSGSYNLPLGSYTIDLQVSNSAGTQELKNIMKINIIDGAPIEISPETGTFSLGLLVANTAGGAGAAGGSNNGLLSNSTNNPFTDYKVTRLADTPNVLIIKIVDKNGIVFNPAVGEIAKRPNSGLNPTPLFLQNLQDYAPDTYVATSSAISIKFPLTPFPIVSLGNGYNMYYRIPTKFVEIDSTSSWPSNAGGGFYQGLADSHYLGVYTLDKYDFSLRIPLRIQVPGSYEIDIKFLNITHR